MDSQGLVLNNVQYSGDTYCYGVPIINAVNSADQLPQEPILIEEDSPRDNDCTIIETSTQEKSKHNIPNFNAIHKENTHKTQLIETCIIPENSVNEQNQEPIIIEDVSPRDNDCTIIETSTEEKSTLSKHNIPNSNAIHKENTHKKQLIEKCIIPENSVNEQNQEPIFIEDVPPRDNDCTIIETSTHEYPKISKHNIPTFSEIFKENILLTELIEKCLDMENSEGMSRIILRTLLPIYNDADEQYKKSESLRKLLNQKIRKLDTEPDRKFSHMKDLCEALKRSRKVKRVSLITLSTTVNGKRKYDIESSSNISPPKKSKTDIIDLDDGCNSDSDVQIYDKQVQNHHLDQSSNNHEPLVNLDSDSDVEINETPTFATKKDSDFQLDEPGQKNTQSIANDDDIILFDNDNDTSNKENYSTNRKNLKTRRKGVKTNKKDNFNSSIEIDLCDDDEASNSNNVFDPGDLLEPKSQETMAVMHPNVKAEIEKIESEIKEYNRMIQILDEREVTNDDFSSPYVLCEQYKAKIVSLYKALCELTGTTAVKRHEVRLQVAKGHHEGPVRFLEEFVNSNIDEEGNPPFPDIFDVKKCVCKANSKYNLGWDSKRIVAEARALFTHYGRAVQKRRQKREWQDLMTLVKQEGVDPADEDRTLQARLMENKKIAQRNEEMLLERFAKMESQSIPNPELRLSFNESENEEDSECDSTSYIPNISNVTSRETPLNTKNNNNFAVKNVTVSSKTSDGKEENNNLKVNSYATSTDSNGRNIMNEKNPEITNNLRDRNAVLSDKHIKTVEKNAVRFLEINVNMEISVVNKDLIGIDILKKQLIDDYETQGKEVNNSGNAGAKSLETKHLSQAISDNETIKLNKAKTDDECAKSLETEQFNEESSLNNAQIKVEPEEDIPRMLEALGNNFTRTIFEFDDPFLVIEISDSSESEDEGVE